MSTSVEYGSKAAADAAREEWADYVCPVDDDKRLKTVAYVSDVPDNVMSQIRADADEDRAARDDTTGQVNLTDAEKKRIDFSRGKANIPWARSIRGATRRAGKPRASRATPRPRRAGMRAARRGPVAATSPASRARPGAWSRRQVNDRRRRAGRSSRKAG